MTYGVRVGRVGRLDYTDPDLPPELRAAIEFLAADRRWTATAVDAHTPTEDGLCRACWTLRWPCLTRELADAARRATLADPARPPIRRTLTTRQEAS